ncbi:MAG TPA: septum formation family protein [Arthrobacter sp.]|nr:septum formation family protein [Arthrobacter sp.]
MSEKPDNGASAGRGDARIPGVSPVNNAGGPVSPSPRIPSAANIPPRPSAPPTSAIPTTPTASPGPAPAPQGTEGPFQAPASTPQSPGSPAEPGRTRRKSGGAGQVGKLLSARAAQLRSSGAGVRARELGATAVSTLRRSNRAKLIAALAAVVVLALLIWWITALGTAKQEAGAPTPAAGTSSSAASRGPLPLEGVSPLDYRLGDCFKDFDANAAKSTVVACNTGHSAQLVAVQSYAASDAYPGRDPLKQKALDACKAAVLTDKSSDYAFSYKLAYPSSSSWGTGDRRVDCYFVADAGNVIMESLLP